MLDNMFEIFTTKILAATWKINALNVTEHHCRQVGFAFNFSGFHTRLVLV